MANHPHRQLSANLRVREQRARKRIEERLEQAGGTIYALSEEERETLALLRIITIAREGGAFI